MPPRREQFGSHKLVRGGVDAELCGESNASAEWVVGADFEEFFDTKVSFSYINNGINTYVRPKLNNLDLLLPPNFDCRILFDLVKSKAKVFNSNISLSFQHPVHGYVMNILDEADVHQLRNVISETKEIVHLYLEVFQGLVEQTEAVEKVVPYNVENIVSDNVEDCPEEETVALNTVEEKNLYEFGRLTDKTFSDGEESNEGWSEDEFTHGKKASNIFYGMPPIPDCPDPIVEPGPFHSLGTNDDIWHLYAKRLDPTDEFEIRTFNNVYTCSSLQIHPNHKHANKKFMGTILHEIMGKTRFKVWRPNEISRDLNALLEINVDYKQAWRAKQYAMELLLGSSKECFAKLPIYFHNLKRHNPGTVAYIQTNSEDCFECCFYAIGSTGAFKGTILHAIAMDGNNQILPLAHGICKKKRVVLHGHGNIVHKFGKNDKTKVLFWRLVKAYKRNVFEELWYRFSYTRQQVAAYLSEIPRAKWTRAYSPSKSYDYMTSNSAESMNALSVDARKMPIIPLLEFFRRLSQEWSYKRRIEGVLTEWAEKVVSKNEERTTGWSVSGVSDALYEVHDFKHGGIVDLSQETCKCKYWEGTGLPCGHVIMVLKHLKKTNFGHLAIDAYKMETYRSTYEEPVYPLPEPCDWEIPTDMMVVKPPIMDTRQAGRPRKRNRIPSQGEEPIVRRCSRCDSTTHNATTCPTLVPKKQKKARKTSTTTGSNTKGKGKGTEGTQEMLETHGTQEARWTSGMQREDYCSTFDFND
ncbi:unnamed protein product [Lactuca saligna]|uniref:SWIM-type domain-containing protein n=1 Tax=Lactuca saligna TaxID=75948 RepID=A0AA36E2K1_LACSI|nr:unnamed protein product [Lactuca saligna]